MGCDIHQINIMIGQDLKPWLIDGELPEGEETEYKSKYVEEIVPGRSYDMFAILAGVRGDMFQIQDNAHSYIPDELPPKIQDWLNDRDYCFHSFTWYFLADLYHELKWTRKKMSMYLKARAVQDPSFISDGEIDEFRWLMHSVSSCIKTLKKTQEQLESEGRGEDFKTSKVLFFFDS